MLMLAKVVVLCASSQVLAELAVPRRRALGGWCMAAYGNKCTWGTQANVLLPGGFQPDAMVFPNPENWAGQAYPKGVWLTMGGDGVGLQDPAACFRIPKILREAEAVKATGLGFDIEGCYHGRTNELVKALKESNVQMPVMYIPLGDKPVKPKYQDLKDVFDVIAPMLYWGDHSYQGNGITCERIKQWVQEWHDAGWPARKMYLTFQSQSAGFDERGKVVLTCLAEEVQRKDYLGLLGWPSLYQSVNEDNLKLISDTWKVLDRKP